MIKTMKREKIFKNYGKIYKLLKLFIQHNQKMSKNLKSFLVNNLTIRIIGEIKD